MRKLKVKRSLLAVILLVVIKSHIVMSQDSDKENNLSIISGIELAWSLANYGEQNNPNDQLVRFSPINIQSIVIYDTGVLGYFGGLSLRNNGFLLPGEGEIDRIKYRSYNVGLPVGLKVGNGRLLTLYIGYELELPIHYKEKIFSSNKDQKEKNTEWFSDKVPSLNHSTFLGFQVLNGINVKMKYYFTNFFNKSYRDETGNQIFEEAKVNLYQISLNFFLFKNDRFFHSKKAIDQKPDL